jgi:hypothetical protein
MVQTKPTEQELSQEQEKLQQLWVVYKVPLQEQSKVLLSVPLQAMLPQVLQEELLWAELPVPEQIMRLRESVQDSQVQANLNIKLKRNKENKWPLMPTQKYWIKHWIEQL